MYNSYMLFSFFTKKNKKENISLHSKRGLTLSSSKGFTLIEVMVAVSIFAIVVTVGVGSLMTVNKAYRQSQAQRAAIDNVSFALEAMTREIRIGQSYTIGYSVGISTARTNDEGSAFSFSSFDADGDMIDPTIGAPYEPVDDDVTYSLVTQIGLPGKIMMQIGNNTSMELTSNDVDVKSLEFVLREDQQQPYVSIHIVAEATDAQQTSQIIMQTGVSQRLLLQI